MSNHRNTKGVYFILLCTVMSACSVFGTTQPFASPSSVTPQIFEESTAEIKTPAFISKLTPTVQLTNEATSTPALTQTAIISLPTKTQDPQTWQTKQTNILKATQIASFPAKCEKYYVQNTFLSVNGNWLAISCLYTQDPTLEIKNKAGKQWVLYAHDFLKEYFARQGGAGYGDGLYSKYWTSDEQYLYFASLINIDGGGGGACFYGFGEEGLYRINVNTGDVSAVLPASNQYAFSPDEGKLAYIEYDPKILNLRTGEIIPIKNADDVVGDLTWSPDGSQLAFSACQLSEDFTKVKKSSIKIYSLETHQSKTILEIEGGFLRIESKDGDKTLKIYDAFINPPDNILFDWSID